MKFLLKMLFWAGREKLFVLNVHDHGMGQSWLLYFKNVSGGDIVIGDKVQMLDNNVKAAD